MSPDFRRLIFHALCVLEGTVREAMRIGAVPPGAPVRLALGVLHFAAERRGVARRELYEEFWYELTKRSETDTHTAVGFGRWQHLNTYLNGIARDAGMERDHAYDAARSRVESPRDPPERWFDEDLEAAICNRKHQSEKAVQLWLEQHGVAIDSDWTDKPRPGQIFPTGKKTPRYGLVVRRQQEGNRPLVASLMEWGFPTTVKGARGQPLTKYVTNARNLRSPFWRASLANPAQRCLVPFTHFAEPHPEGGRGDDFLPKQAWFCLPDQPVGVFAGLWRQTERGPAYAFATCEPNAIVAPIHPKAMPAILRPDEWNTWLDGSAEEATALVRPYDGPMDVQVTTPRLSDGGSLDIVEPV